MELLQCRDAYWKFLGQCTQCGHCKHACSSLTSADMTLGDIASGMLHAEAESEDASDLMFNILGNEALTQAVRGCFFCTSCKNTCFAHNDVCDLIYHARIDFQALGLIPREAWSSVLVDQQWDIFTSYRAIHGIYYLDLTRHVEREGYPTETDCEIAFFPGCSLAAYGEGLTREVFETIEKLGGKTTMLDHCCGSPLKSAGFFDRAEALCDRIADEVRVSGAKTVVCVCPGCANAMKSTLARRGMQVDVVSLPKFLIDHGFTPKKEIPGNLCISKSCQDRTGSYLDELISVLGIDADTPAIFKGCCGAGGAVSAFQPERQAAQADSKLSFAPDGSTVVTMCPTCTYTYASRLMEDPRPIENRHYTELLFENEFDWDLNFAQLNTMWSGEYGPWLAQVFA